MWKWSKDLVMITLVSPGHLCSQRGFNILATTMWCRYWSNCFTSINYFWPVLWSRCCCCPHFMISSMLRHAKVKWFCKATEPVNVSPEVEPKPPWLQSRRSWPFTVQPPSSEILGGANTNRLLVQIIGSIEHGFMSLWWNCINFCL